MWRVAAETVVDRPLLGAGVDNFAVDFARERSTYEEPLYPHSVFLRAFSQTGLVGGALFVGFVAAALLAAVRVARRSAGLANAVAAASIASAAYWLVHSSLDWFWEIPVLTAPALALLALASRLEQPSFDRRRSKRLRSLRVRAIAPVLGAAALGSYAFPGLAAAALERAVAAWPTAPDRTFAELDRARRLNPLSERADLVAGTLLQRAGQPADARIAFERALDRNPADWYAHLRLALLDAAAAQRAQALAELSRAEVLNPLEPAIPAAEDGLFDPGRRQQLMVRLDQLAVQGPLGRRPVACRPILGIAGSCMASGSS
jgi:tetratricopeptide (TPR) repeat protein